MSLIELSFLAISLSMDAFAVAICRGLALKGCRIRDMVTVGLYFGVFQMLMPLLGYTVGLQLAYFMDAIGSVIPPLVLSVIGGNMILGSMGKEEDKGENEAVSDFLARNKLETGENTANYIQRTSDLEEKLPSPSTMIALALATSMDAFAVGVTFIPLEVSAVPSSFFIGVTTFLCSSLGVKLGFLFGLKYKKSAERFGGGVLLAMAVRVYFLGS